MDKRKLYIAVTAVILGFFTMVQSKSLENVNNLLQRDSKSNVFQEIKILKDKNGDLKNEIDDLETSIGQLTDQNKALNAVQDEIDRYTKLSGNVSVFGPGVTVQISGKVTTPWVIDLINEFFNSGAQAVSINDIRIINKTAGFDVLPQGQMLLNGSILTPPYEFNAIGEGSTLANILQSPGAIFDRLKKAFPDAKINITTKDIIKMN